jgi:hypothetical protein
MLDLGSDFCDLFDATASRCTPSRRKRTHIVSKVKTGLSSIRDLQLPIGPGSVAGFVAQSRQTVNVADVYDEAELRRSGARRCSSSAGSTSAPATAPARCWWRRWCRGTASCSAWSSSSTTAAAARSRSCAWKA